MLLLPPYSHCGKTLEGEKLPHCHSRLVNERLPWGMLSTSTISVKRLRRKILNLKVNCGTKSGWLRPETATSIAPARRRQWHLCWLSFCFDLASGPSGATTVVRGH